MDRASCEHPVTRVNATTPSVNMLLSLSHVAACGQSSNAAPASSSLDPPPAGGHVDMLFCCTFVLTMSVSVKLLMPGLDGRTRHTRVVLGQAPDERVRAQRAPKVVLRETGHVGKPSPVLTIIHHKKPRGV